MIVIAGAKLMSVALAHYSDIYIETNEIKNINGGGNPSRIVYGSTDKFGIAQSDNMTGSNYGMIAFLGVSNVPVKSSDYFLNDVTVGNENVNNIIRCVQCRNHPLATPKGLSYQYTFINSGSSAIEIKEICLCMRFSANEVYMVARKVIPTRLVQPDETITFSYELNWF